MIPSRIDEHYTAGFEGNRIRKISKDGIVTTIAGSDVYDFKDETGTEAQFRAPRGICIDPKGNLYVGDCWNYRIRKISPEGEVSTYAGNGKETAEYTGAYKDGKVLESSFDAPCGVSLDPNGNLYVADANNHKIRKISVDGIVSTIAGNGPVGKGNGGLKDGSYTESVLNTPTELFADTKGNVYFSDTYNNCIRKIDLNGIITTIYGMNENQKDLNYPRGITKAGNSLYFVNHNNNCIKRIEL